MYIIICIICNTTKFLFFSFCVISFRKSFS
nr:MAG TPA: hypothetical protein [Bacteriophage sp.]